MPGFGAEFLDIGTGIPTANKTHDPYQLVADLMDTVPPGSFLAVTHPARD